MDAASERRLQRRTEALLRQHIDGVVRASSVSNESGSRARSLVLLTMLAPVSRTARFEDQLQLDGESNAKIADRYGTGSSARRNVAVGDFPARRFQRQRAPAGPPNSGFRADTPRMHWSHELRALEQLQVFLSALAAPPIS